MDPNFAKCFSVDYMFEEVQKVKVAVYDLDNNTPDLGDDDFLGQVECTLGQVRNFFFHFELIIIHWTGIVGISR